MSRLAPAGDQAAIVDRIVRNLSMLRDPLGRKDWAALRAAVENVPIVLKGEPRTHDELERFVTVATRAVRDLTVVVDALLEQAVLADRAEFFVRAVIAGQRLDGSGPDGIVVDARLRFEAREGSWPLVALWVDCPPPWAQWSNRPNTCASVFGGR